MVVMNSGIENTRETADADGRSGLRMAGVVCECLMIEVGWLSKLKLWVIGVVVVGKCNGVLCSGGGGATCTRTRSCLCVGALLGGQS